MRAIGLGTPPPWHVVEGQRGQRLLDEGRIVSAAEVFAAILQRLDSGPSYGRAMILGRLGRCRRLAGELDQAVACLREALAVAGALAPSDGVKRLRGTLRSELGDALRAAGRPADARKSYEAALRVAEEVGDLRAQVVECDRLGGLALAEGGAVEAATRYETALRLSRQLRDRALEALACHQLGGVHLSEGRWAMAEERLREAAALRGQLGDDAGAAQSAGGLAQVYRRTGRAEAAEAAYRHAVALDRKVGERPVLARHLAGLADLLRENSDRLAEARRAAEESLRVAQEDAPLGPDACRAYTLLSEIARGQAGSNAESRALEEVSRSAPLVLASLARLGAEQACGRAVLLGRLGEILILGRRPDLAATRLREALDAAEQVGPAEDGGTLHAWLWSALGAALQAAGDPDGAGQAFRTARELAPPSVTAEPASAPGLDIMVHEEIGLEYVFDPDLLIDGPRKLSEYRWPGEPSVLAQDIQPALLPGTRTWQDEDGGVRIVPPVAEPDIEGLPGCVAMRRARREVSVSRGTNMVWRVLRELDGGRPLCRILEGHDAAERREVERLVDALIATGALDVSGRPSGTYLHRVTKKGVLPGGGLGGDEVLRMATDGDYREYPDRDRLKVAPSVPPPLRAFHALTRSRRSSRDYRGRPLSREHFDALLQTSCGVTGSLAWEGREVKLRAYPSSGALYAVEIYPVVFRVEGLDPAIYHFRPTESLLETVRPGLDRGRVVVAALPVEREMVERASVVFCLTGVFQRHERKYGEGGYRMLIAEAGHISQNLILAATALGASARPFGGVFDDLVNQELGLDVEAEQFLLAVLVGYTGSERRTR